MNGQKCICSMKQYTKEEGRLYITRYRAIEGQKLLLLGATVKPVYNGHSKKDRKLVFKTNYRLMQVKSIAEGEHSTIRSTFIKLPFVIQVFVLSIFEWLFHTDFTVISFL